MDYYFNKIVTDNFNDVIVNVTELLRKEGFGILTEINIQETFKKKLNLDFRKYRILGACNPPFAYTALSAEDKIGTMLPCNIIIQELSTNTIEVAAVNPIASMQAIENDILNEIASDISQKLKNVINNL